MKNNKNICLNGLCNWEQLLLDEGNNSRMSSRVTTFKEINDIDEKLKEDIEKELLISKACINLGEWDKLESHFSKIDDIFKDYYNLENQLITKENENSEEDNIDDYDYTYNSNTNVILGNSNIKYLESLYFNIPKYLNKYDIKKNISIFKNQVNLYSYQDAEESKKKDTNIFICYNDIINNSPSMSFLLNQDETIFDLNLYSSILHIENKEYNLALEYIAEGKKMINYRIKS